MSTEERLLESNVGCAKDNICAKCRYQGGKTLANVGTSDEA